MKRGTLLLWLLATGACGEDGLLDFPEPRGAVAELLALAPGAELHYRLDGDPRQSATLRVLAAEGGLWLLELRASDPEVPRTALLVRPAADALDVLRVERGAVRVELDPPLRVLAGPLERGRAFSSATAITLLGGRLGVNLLGVTRAFGEQIVLGTAYEAAFSVDVSVQTDLLGRTRVELVLARGAGPVLVRVVSPAVEQLGLAGVRVQLELTGRSGARGEEAQ
jgi:hypothetical protein